MLAARNAGYSHSCRRRVSRTVADRGQGFESADELAQNLGPVGPHDPILTTVGINALSRSMNQIVATALSAR
jgi:hypothetical protein